MLMDRLENVQRKEIKVIRWPWLAHEHRVKELRWTAELPHAKKEWRISEDLNFREVEIVYCIPPGGIIGVNEIKLSKENFRVYISKHFLIMRSFIILSQWKY
jgi:hypothetical protein